MEAAALVAPAGLAQHGSLTPEQLAKHQTYRARKQLKQYRLQPSAQPDVTLPLSRTPMSPPVAPVPNKQIVKHKAATKHQPFALSTNDKKLLLNRAVDYKQNKLQKLKAEAMRLQAALKAKEAQQALLLVVLAAAEAAAAKAAHQQLAVATTVAAVIATAVAVQ